MKIRWTEESVRFRITPTELEQLQKGEKIEARLGFGDGEWAAQIAPGDAHGITFRGERLMLTLSAENLSALAAPENEGIYFHQEPRPHRYFVEKDYPCIHPRGGETLEPVTEAFSAPEGFSERKLAP